MFLYAVNKFIAPVHPAIKEFNSSAYAICSVTASSYFTKQINFSV